MDAIDFLVKHHRQLEQQLTTLKRSETVDQNAFDALADSLAAHITVEEEIFYPAVKARRTEEILLESLEEHLSLKRVLADLLDLGAKDQKFSPKLHVLAEQAEHHHEEEEEHLFPKVRKVLDDAHRETLGAEMSARMTALMQASPRDRVRSQTAESAALA
ncbi:MAG: hemerythrin domain-containing protein [Deltaproteobacteria bacterium]|nr:hemerythrin domain-containing protein [Deltaproteobacteria bacterium]